MSLSRSSELYKSQWIAYKIIVPVARSRLHAYGSPQLTESIYFTFL